MSWGQSPSEIFILNCLFKFAQRTTKLGCLKVNKRKQSPKFKINASPYIMWSLLLIYNFFFFSILLLSLLLLLLLLSLFKLFCCWFCFVLRVDCNQWSMRLEMRMGMWANKNKSLHHHHQLRSSSSLATPLKWFSDGT